MKVSIEVPITTTGKTVVDKQIFVKNSRFNGDYVTNNVGISYNYDAGLDVLVPEKMYGIGRQVVGDVILVVSEPKANWLLIFHSETLFSTPKVIELVLEALKRELIYLVPWIYQRDADWFSKRYDLRNVYPDLSNKLTEDLEANKKRWEQRFGLSLPVDTLKSPIDGLRWPSCGTEVVTLLDNYGAINTTGNPDDLFYFSDGCGKRKATPFVKFGLSVAAALSARPHWATYVIRVRTNAYFGKENERWGVKINTFKIINKTVEKKENNEKTLV
jgi:hypothetical protein